jgi:hypothetical protein
MPWNIIHYVDAARIDTELRPICGAWHDRVTWTTVRALMTCPACARLSRVAQPERRPSGAPARAVVQARIETPSLEEEPVGDP